MPLTTVRYTGAAEPYFETALTGRPQSWRRGQTAEVDSAIATTLIASGLFVRSGDDFDGLIDPSGPKFSEEAEEAVRKAAPGAVPSSVTVRNVGEHSPLVKFPLRPHASPISATLGPSSNAAASAEYNGLRANRREIRFVAAAEWATNSASLHTYGVVGLDNPWNVSTRLHGRPWPQVGQNNWWATGGLAFDFNGNQISICYANNAPNSARVFVDGCTVAGAAADGTISNGVASSGNQPQWVTLQFPEWRTWRIVIPLMNVYSLVMPHGATLSGLNLPKCLLLGDSFASWTKATGETQQTLTGMYSSALQALGWDVIDCSEGGTGFFANGGGRPSGKQNYSDGIDYLLTHGVGVGFDPAAVGRVVLGGSGNDGALATPAGFAALLAKARVSFPNAEVVVTTCYEGFNTAAQARAINDMLVPAALSAGAAVVPVDSFYSPDKAPMFSGSGSVPAPANDGNADYFLSNAAQGAGDRHPNAQGTLHGANYVARRLISLGLDRFVLTAPHETWRPVIESRSVTLLPAAAAITADGAISGFATALTAQPPGIVRVHASLAGAGGYTGIYWATFSSTSACQLWLDPAATRKPSGLTVGAYAGTTAVVALGSAQVPPAELGENGSLRYLPVWVGSAGSRTYQISLNGNVLQQATNGSAGQYVPVQAQTFLRGRSTQFSIGSGLQTSGSAGTYTTIDTQVTPLNVEFRCQLASANDWAILEAWTVELFA